ncbi:hypothetical protein ACLB2K_013716 [Fragaria x ananassa]
MTRLSTARHAARVSPSSADLLAQHRPAARESRQLARTNSLINGPPRRRVSTSSADLLAQHRPAARESHQLARTDSPINDPPLESLAIKRGLTRPASARRLRVSPTSVD